MFDIENSQIQALYGSKINVYTNLLLEIPFDKFCDKFPGLYQLKK